MEGLKEEILKTMSIRESIMDMRAYFIDRIKKGDFNIVEHHRGNTTIEMCGFLFRFIDYEQFNTLVQEFGDIQLYFAPTEDYYQDFKNKVKEKILEKELVTIN